MIYEYMNTKEQRLLKELTDLENKLYNDINNYNDYQTIKDTIELINEQSELIEDEFYYKEREKFLIDQMFKYNSMTINQLKAKLKDLNKRTAGKKDLLIERLIDHDINNEFYY